jgi:hypothetical protein
MKWLKELILHSKVCWRQTNQDGLGFSKWQVEKAISRMNWEEAVE